MEGGAVGIGVLGFWLFIAVVVVAGIWEDARKRESRQETLRRIVESGQKIDPAVIDRILGESDDRKTARDLTIAATIVLCVAPGLAAFALMLGLNDPETRNTLLGAALLVGFVGAGLYLAAKVFRRRGIDQED
jgi:hypothetical protein